jgi:hypothetical protein
MRATRVGAARDLGLDRTRSPCRCEAVSGAISVIEYSFGLPSADELGSTIAVANRTDSLVIPHHPTAPSSTGTPVLRELHPRARYRLSASRSGS